MKIKIKDFVPPILGRLVRKLRSTDRIYQSYADALLHCSNEGYQQVEIVKVVVEKNRKFRETLDSSSTLDLGSLRTLIGLGFVRSGNYLSVLDFGGGAGYHYSIASKVFGNDCILKWAVVETNAMASAATHLSNSELKFFCDFKNALNYLGKVDLVFTSGALQYCSNPMVVLEDLVSVGAKYIYITRTVFNDGWGDIYSIQESFLSNNGPGPLPGGFKEKKIRYPVVFVGRKNVEQLLNRKYDIRLVIAEDKCVFNVGDNCMDMCGYFCVRRDF